MMKLNVIIEMMFLGPFVFVLSLPSYFFSFFHSFTFHWSSNLWFSFTISIDLIVIHFGESSNIYSHYFFVSFPKYWESVSVTKALSE